MRVFVAGGSGVVGKRLIPDLVARGHQVTATTRTPGKKNEIQRLGAEAVALDALDRDAVMRAVASARPDVVVHQLTALSTMRSFKKWDDEFALTNRLRTEGVKYLVEAAQTSGARRIVVQSYAGWPSVRSGGPVKTEDDPLDATPPQSMKRSLAAIRELETTVASVRDLEGIVVRYGNFYGPGTAIAPNGQMVEMVRLRRFPVFGGGAGVWSFIHIADLAQATRLAIESGPAGIYNIVDDDPAPVSSWLPELARAAGAKPPYHLPAWIGRLAIGEAGTSLMTQARGASNAKAKRVLNWKLTYPSWRDGFHRVLAPEVVESAWPSSA
jgi:nucleoside-diphosphate-sugar epimerase